MAIGRKAAVANRVVKKDNVLSIIPFAIQIPANRFELLNKEALVSGQQSGARELAPTVQRADMLFGDNRRGCLGQLSRYFDDVATVSPCLGEDR